MESLLGFLVNISRGTVVDEQVLVQALSENRIAGAGLDVCADEPTVPPALQALYKLASFSESGAVKVSSLPFWQ